MSGKGDDEGGNYIIEGKLCKSGYHELFKKYKGVEIILRGRTEKKGDTVERLYGVWELPDVTSGDYEYKRYG